MDSPLQITLRDVPRSPELEQAIRDRATKLERFFADILNCRVSVAYADETRHRQGVLNVRVELHVPGQAIVTFGKSDDARVAVREAFDHAALQVRDYAQRLRGHLGRNHSVA
jgi:ribosomal subunit interface protein